MLLTFVPCIRNLITLSRRGLDLLILTQARSSSSSTGRPLQGCTSAPMPNSQLRQSRGKGGSRTEAAPRRVGPCVGTSAKAAVGNRSLRPSRNQL
jgi:hypothetical protein